jgi:hypothetical protein
MPKYHISCDEIRENGMHEFVTDIIFTRVANEQGGKKLTARAKRLI